MKEAIKKINGKKKAVNTADPEKLMLRLARSGTIASAGKKAIAASFKKGLSVTALENGVIYRIHPDGKRTVLKRKPSILKKYVSGTMLIR